MTINEAVIKMQAAVTAAKERLLGNGFVMSVETDYMNAMLRTVPDESKAKFITVSLVVGKDGGKEGEEYCMSLGAEVIRKSIDEAQLDRDIESYGKMVDDAIETLAGYENKDEGLDYLTKKAGEEYEKLLEKIKEDQKKSRKVSMIINTVFIVGMILLFIIALLR